MSSFLSQHANCRIRTCGISEIYDRLAIDRLAKQKHPPEISVAEENGTRKCRKNYEGQVSKYMEQKRG